MRQPRRAAYSKHHVPELLAGYGDANSILLTFDDGWSSVWSAAAPIASRYSVKFTLFLAPECVEESLEIRTTIDTGASPAEVAPRDLGHRARLTWGEVLALQMTGFVDIQSHSSHHGVVFRSPRPKGFATPSGPFPLNGLAPLVQREVVGDSVQFQPALGTPLYEWGPALTVGKRFLESPEIRAKCTLLAREHNFFKRENWRSLLNAVAHDVPEQWESADVRRERLRADLQGSRQMIENRIPGTRVTVLAPPWAQIDPMLAEVAREVGYELVVLGYPFHVGHLGSSVPLYPRLFGDASWIPALGTLRGAPRWWQARARALERRRTGAIP
ncbi:MAG: polysaccharide deacetylase family protein [Gammaproteobacteria bacterium]